MPSRDNTQLVRPKSRWQAGLHSASGPRQDGSACHPQPWCGLVRAARSQQLLRLLHPGIGVLTRSRLAAELRGTPIPAPDTCVGDTRLTQAARDSPATHVHRHTVRCRPRCTVCAGQCSFPAVTRRRLQTGADGGRRVESSSQAEYAGSIPVIGSTCDQPQRCSKVFETPVSDTRVTQPGPKLPRRVHNYKFRNDVLGAALKARRSSARDGTTDLGDG
jgi:hypothetical protein